MAEANTKFKTLSISQHPSASGKKLSDFCLTRRETEVALLLLDGKTREEITHLLCISMGTVHSHCSNLYRKAGVSSVAGLIRCLNSTEPDLSSTFRESEDCHPDKC